MPQGYYVVQQSTCPTQEAAAAWIPVLVLPFGATLTAAEQALAELQEPGFYRIVQMQRVIWAEREAGVLRLRKSTRTPRKALRRCKRCFSDATGAIHVRKFAPPVIYPKPRKRVSAASYGEDASCGPPPIAIAAVHRAFPRRFT